MAELISKLRFNTLGLGNYALVVCQFQNFTRCRRFLALEPDGGSDTDTSSITVVVVVRQIGTIHTSDAPINRRRVKSGHL